MILDLVAAGRRVGVTANSHKVIGNLLDAVVKAATEAGRSVEVGQKPGADQSPPASTRPATRTTTTRCEDRVGEVDVLGGDRAWMWAREDFAGAVDVLFVDEAGQFALANAVCVSPAAASLVLLGDPQQLDQPIQGTHPPGAERSALAHLLEAGGASPPDHAAGARAVPRAHGGCTSTSPVHLRAVLRRQARPRARQRGPVAGGCGAARWRGPPLGAGGTCHREATESDDEADAVAGMVADLLGSGATWVDRDGVERAIRDADVLVLTTTTSRSWSRQRSPGRMPGRACRHRRQVRGPGGTDLDHTMASSSADEAPHGMEFLYSLNRLNVATSRARCLATVVASPS
ncbi:MAG: hypothetical protein R3C32_05135 [Chloroflexota bacterium]